MADADQSNLTMLTVDLLSAYVANNNVQHGDLSELIKSTHAALKVIDAPEEPAAAGPEYKPAVGVRKSLGSRTHIISMIDGKPYQTLKRHLSKHGLTPQDYRERYSLPRDYPMVAPAYSESRRAIAERLGLGRKAAGTPAPVAADKGAAPEPDKILAAKAKAARPAAKASPEASVPAATAVKPAKQAASPRGARKPAAKAPAIKPAPRKRGAKAAPAAEQGS